MDANASTRFTNTITSSKSRIKCLLDTHKVFGSTLVVARHGSLLSQLPNNIWLSEKTWAVLYYNPKLYKEDLSLTEIKKKVMVESKKIRDQLARMADLQAKADSRCDWTTVNLSDDEQKQRKKAIDSYKDEKNRALTKQDKSLCDVPVAVFSLEKISIESSNKVINGWQGLQKVDRDLKDAGHDFGLVVQDSKRKFLKLAETKSIVEDQKLIDWLGDYVAAQNVIRYHRFIRLIGTDNPHAMLINLILESLEEKALKPAHAKTQDPMQYLRMRCTQFDSLLAQNKGNCEIERMLRRLYGAIINNLNTILFRNIFLADSAFLMESIAGSDYSERATDFEKAYFKMVFGIK